MMINFSKPISFLLALSALAFVSNAAPAQAQTDNTTNTAPMTGTVTNSAIELQQSPVIYETVPSTTVNTTNPTVSQSTQIAQDTIDVGRPTQGGSSYIGVAGNIGLGGDTALGSTNFALISKLGLTRNVSIRPGVIFGNDTTFLLPITYDFAFRSADPLANAPVSPYLGVGATVSTDSDAGFLVTGGLDVPLSRNFTANAGVNASFKGETEVGIMLGIGYNFFGF